MRPSPLLAVAVVLVLGGCSGLIDTVGDEGEDRRSTITPASVPAEFDHPPGVNPTRITLEPDLLVRAHGQRVDEGRVAIQLSSRRQLLPNGSTHVSREQTVLTDDRSVFYTFSNNTAGYVDGTWSNGTHTLRYVRTPEFTTTNLTARPSVPDPSVDVAYRTRLGIWLNNSDLRSIDRIDTDDGTRYRITATSNESAFVWPRDIWTSSNVTNGSLVAVVRPDGLITSMRVEYTLTTTRGRYRFEHRLTATAGVVRLPRPVWVDRALANRTSG